MNRNVLEDDALMEHLQRVVDSPTIAKRDDALIDLEQYITPFAAQNARRRLRKMGRRPDDESHGALCADAVVEVQMMALEYRVAGAIPTFDVGPAAYFATVMRNVIFDVSEQEYPDESWCEPLDFDPFTPEVVSYSEELEALQDACEDDDEREFMRKIYFMFQTCPDWSPQRMFEFYVEHCGSSVSTVRRRLARILDRYLLQDGRSVRDVQLFTRAVTAPTVTPAATDPLNSTAGHDRQSNFATAS